MVHSKGMIVCLKVNGKVLKESHETVHVPFDSEYSIYLKNLKPNQKALVDVYVDGQEAIKGLIVPAASSVNLERFHDGKNGIGRRFMFVEKDDAVEARRDNKVEDGLIRVEYQFESYVAPSYTFTWNNINEPTYGYKSLRGTGVDPQVFSCSARSVDDSVCCAFAAPANDAGITERGSISNQQFIQGSIGFLEFEKHSLVLSMKGFREDSTVATTIGTVWTPRKPMFTGADTFCTNCGKKSGKGDKFCSKCGTKLK